MLNVPCSVSLDVFFGQKPGDPCPDDDCLGTIGRIDSSWTEHAFGADAICDVCAERWPLIEILTLVSYEQSVE